MNALAAVRLAGFADAWAAALWRASWQGAIALAAAWLVTHALVRARPAFKCWVWRMAYIKVLAALLLATPVTLPVLPAASFVALDAREGQTAELPAPQAPEFAASIQPGTAHQATGSSQRSSIGELLFAAWAVGAALVLVRLALGWRAARSLRRHCEPVNDPALLEACTGLSTRYGLRRPPPLAWNKGLRSPLLLGPLRPLVVLPADAPALHTPAELRLMLAHELAHLRRDDLWWNWLPAAAQTLLFFHPLVWLAGREWRLAQESACDEAAVGATGASPAQYGDMLLGVIAAPREIASRFTFLPATAAAGVVESPKTLRRRLTAMRHFKVKAARLSPARRATAVACAFIAVGLTLVPLRLVAKEPVPRADSQHSAVVPDAGPRSETGPVLSPDGPAPQEDVILDLNQSSTLKAPEAALAAASDGIVRAVKVEEGQRVKKGEVLVELDPDRVVAELQLAKGDLELKALELRRKQELLREKKAINEAEVAESEFGVKRAQNVLAIKEHELEQTRVAAPFDGVVVKVDATPGVFLPRGRPAVTLIEADRIWAEVLVPPAGLSVLKKGTRAELTPIGVPPDQERMYLGRVISISPTIHPESHTGTVRVRPDGPAGDLRPGGMVKVRFLRDKQGE